MQDAKTKLEPKNVRSKRRSVKRARRFRESVRRLARSAEFKHLKYIKSVNLIFISKINL